MSTEPTPAEKAIKEFPFWNYGMDGVDIALREDPEAQEWVPALAAKIEVAVREQVAAELEAAADRGDDGSPWGHGMETAVRIARGGGQ